MTAIAGCREIRQALGVYVLGAIDPSERSQVDEHLAVCADCRAELAGLAGLPALLRRVPFDEVERLTVAEPGTETDLPSEELLPSLLERAGRVRRVHRWRGLAAAAAVVVLALGGGALTANAFNTPSSPGVAKNDGDEPVLTGHWQKAWTAHPGIHMVVKYRGVAWGTLMNVQVFGPKPGIRCQLEVTDKAGHTYDLGGWTLNYRGGPAWYPASTWVPESQVRDFQLTSGGHVLARVSPS